MEHEKTKRPKAPINKQTHSIIFQRILIYHIDIDEELSTANESTRSLSLSLSRL